MTEAKILADSVNSRTGDRLTTFWVKCPIWVWYELLTHRLLSRNCESTRARTHAKFRADVLADPAMPSVWTCAEAAGMAANREHPQQDFCGTAFLMPLRKIAETHDAMEGMGVSKQDSNILLLPWWNVRAIVSATEWTNFFDLRCSLAARPDMRLLAEKMRDLRNGNKPQVLLPGRWHIPLADTREVSVGRCGRVSYGKVDGKTAAEDIELHRKLFCEGHFSPFEHQAVALEESELVGNFVGWAQYRTFVDDGDVEATRRLSKQEAREKYGRYL